MLSHVFGLENPRDFASVVRRIVTKLIVKVGVDQVRRHTLKEHQPLVRNVEKERRKKRNAGERKRMLAMLGKDEKSKENVLGLGPIEVDQTTQDEAMDGEDHDDKSDSSDDEDDYSDLDEDAIRGGID